MEDTMNKRQELAQALKVVFKILNDETEKHQDETKAIALIGGALSILSNDKETCGDMFLNEAIVPWLNQIIKESEEHSF
jgi:hypothetical protein